MEKELKDLISKSLEEGLAEANKETAEKIETVEAGLEDIKKSLETAKKDALSSGLSRSQREMIGKGLKGMFVEKFGERGIAQKDYIAIGTAGGGKELAGKEIAQGILSIAKTHGVILSLASKFVSKSQTFSVIVDADTGNNGGFVDEGAVVGQDKLGFIRVSIVAKKWKKDIAVSEEAIKFSEPVALANYVLSKLGKAFAGFIDAVAVEKMLANTSIPTLALATGKTKFADINHDDLVDLVASIPDTLDPDAVFLGDRSVLGLIQKMKDANGRPLVDNFVGADLVKINRGTNAVPRAKVLNYPYYVPAGMPKTSATATAQKGKAFLFFGSVKDLLTVLVSGGLEVENEKNIRNGIFDFVGTAYVNAEVAQPKAGTFLKTASA